MAQAPAHKARFAATALVLAALGGCRSGDTSRAPAPSGAGGAGTGSGGDSGAAVGGAAIGGSAGAAAGGSSSADSDAPTERITFTASSEPLVNPERGFYRYVDLTTASDLGPIRAQGYSLVFSYVRLDDYRNAPIAASLIDALNRGLALARDAGLKVILRFAYNFGPYPDSEPDASKARILEHIGQLGPHLQANGDTLALVQAGFIGAWGEWHTSTNGLLDNPDDGREILEALLDALPSWMFSQLRYPPHKEGMYGPALPAGQAFTETYAARTGHHNDCFLASETDMGTYPSNEVERYKTYLAEETQFVPMGGETCALHARVECTTALAELERLHFSYLNVDYHPDVIAEWQSAGCLEQIRSRLGYRLRLEHAELAPAVKPGGSFVLALRIVNDGFAAPFNPRPLEFIVAGQGRRYSVRLEAADVRQWLPDAPVDLKWRVRLPADAPEGSYSLALRFPDPSERLAERAEFAIELANPNVWQAEDGANEVGELTISAAAPGTASSDATFGAQPLP